MGSHGQSDRRGGAVWLRSQIEVLPHPGVAAFNSERVTWLLYGISYPLRSVVLGRSKGNGRPDQVQ
jgi:hypothetical protein